MEISILSDTIVTVASDTLSFSNFILNRNPNFTTTTKNNNNLISAVIFPLDALAPPPVKPVKTIPKRLTKKRRRTKRRSLTGGGGDDGEEIWFFGDGGDYSDGGYGGGGWGGGFGGSGGGGGGGKGWNFDGFGGANWEESSSFSDPAFDFVYEVLSWIVLSNCLHFAYKKVVRIVADGFGDPAREKVPIRLTPVC